MFQINFLEQARPVAWVFAVDSQPALHDWLQALHRAQRPQPEAEEVVERRQVEAQQEDEDAQVRVMRAELLERERKEREEQKRLQELEKRKARQREKEQEEAKRKQQIDLELKRLQEEAEKKRQEQAEAARRVKFQRILEHSWDYKFQRLWTQSVRPVDFEDTLKTGIKLFQLLGSFRVKTQAAARLIVDELHLPLDQRQLQPLATDPQPLYLYQHVFYHLAWSQEGQDGGKLLGHEFRAADTVADALFLLARREQVTLRVPLTCVVDYKGFRVLAVACAPVDGDRTLVHGPTQEGVYQTCVSLYKQLTLLAQVLNLKEHKFEWNQRMEPAYVHLSAFLQLHATRGYRDLDSFLRDTAGEETANTSDLHYLLRLADLLPVDAAQDLDFSKRIRPEFLCEYDLPLSADGFVNDNTGQSQDNDLLQAAKILRGSQIERLVAQLDSLELFPVDSRSFTEALHSFGVNMRLLGLVAEYTEMPHVRELAVTEALARTIKRLLFEEIAHLVLTYSEEGTVSTESGITEDPRVFGRKDHPKQLEGNYLEPQTPAPRKRAQSRRTTSYVPMPELQEAERWSSLDPVTVASHSQLDVDLRSAIVDFLNLVFGAGEETEAFWIRIISPQAAQRFSLSPDLTPRASVNLRALLHAVCYHCGLRMVFFKEVQLGTASEPFALQSLERVVERWKAYGLQQSEYRLLGEKTALYRKEKNYQLALQASNLLFRINKAMSPEEDYYGDPALLADIGELLLDAGDLEGAIKKAKESLVQVHPLHVESVKAWCVLMRALMRKGLQAEALQCFDSALSALEFHWGTYHPLHSTVCSLLAALYVQRKDWDNALALYKSALMCCLKVLGPSHMQTAEIYSELSSLYTHMSVWSEALVTCEKSFRIYEALLGETAPITLGLAVQLSKLYGAQGRLQEGVQLATRVIDIRDRILSEGPDSSLIPQHREKVMEALEVGMDLALRLRDSGLVSLFGAKIWNGLEAGWRDYKPEDALPLLRDLVKAAVDLLPADQRSLFISALVNSDAYEVDIEPEHLQAAVKAVRSFDFLAKTRERGGVRQYLAQVFETVCKSYRLVKAAARPEDVRSLQRGLAEAAGLLEAVGPDVISL
jgi:tetratricopeptide (TPR) repeat protein